MWVRPLTREGHHEIRGIIFVHLAVYKPCVINWCELRRGFPSESELCTTLLALDSNHLQPFVPRSA